jgi:monoamine oxidase
LLLDAEKRLRAMKATDGTESFDAIVIGAGAAGLAAAATLADRDFKICVLEARDRLGGRIFTRNEPDVSIPLELGAEFVHGRSAATIHWLRRANAALIDASRTHFTLHNGVLDDSDRTFDRMKAGLARVRRPRKDLSFAAFLNGPARSTLSPRARELARSLVEGFDAADATRASTLEILNEWSGTAAADAPTFRPLGGYGPMIGSIAASLDPARVHLYMNTIVKEVVWERGSVEVRALRFGETLRFRAPHAIVTLPLGVLQLPEHSPHAVRFEPHLKDKARAFAALGFGPVIKVMLHFREPFWESLDRGRLNDAAFFHFPGAPFPTFWTQLPTRSPILTAWCAGPHAIRLEGLDEAQIVSLALTSLTAGFGKRAGVAERVSAAHLHDWQADPFACGAYSFVTVDGRGARAALARPIERTLFFAGEATDATGEAATVAGALRSGEQAAMQICDAADRD